MTTTPTFDVPDSTAMTTARMTTAQRRTCAPNEVTAQRGRPTVGDDHECWVCGAHTPWRPEGHAEWCDRVRLELAATHQQQERRRVAAMFAALRRGAA